MYIRIYIYICLNDMLQTEFQCMGNVHTTSINFETFEWNILISLVYFLNMFLFIISQTYQFTNAFMSSGDIMFQCDNVMFQVSFERKTCLNSPLLCFLRQISQSLMESYFLRTNIFKKRLESVNELVTKKSYKSYRFKSTLLASRCLVVNKGTLNHQAALQKAGQA